MELEFYKFFATHISLTIKNLKRSTAFIVAVRVKECYAMQHE